MGYCRSLLEIADRQRKGQLTDVEVQLGLSPYEALVLSRNPVKGRRYARILWDGGWIHTAVLDNAWEVIECDEDDDRNETVDALFEVATRYLMGEGDLDVSYT